MPTHESDAIVLRQYSLSESDRIVVFITREHGKVRAVARGVKKPKSRLAGRLEPLNHIHLEFYIREGHDLAQVRQTELIHSYLGKNPSLQRIYAYTYFAELINEIIEEFSPNYPLYRLLLASLNAAERLGISQSLIRYFEIWCLKLNGLLPNYVYCSNCGKCVKDEGFYARLESGKVRCEACSYGRGLHIQAVSAVALQMIIKLSPEKFVSRVFSGVVDVDLERLTQGLLLLNLGKHLKSYGALKEVLRDR